MIFASTRGDIADYVRAVGEVYAILIVAYVLTSMFFQVGGRLPYSRALNVVLGFLRDVCEPLLRVFRRVLPPLGPLDLSPMVAIIVVLIGTGIIANIIK